jgi:hypothetical protein
MRAARPIAIDAGDQLAQRMHLRSQSLAAGLGDPDAATRTLALELLLDAHEAGLLEHLDVPRQISVGEAERSASAGRSRTASPPVSAR